MNFVLPPMPAMAMLANKLLPRVGVIGWSTVLWKKFGVISDTVMPSREFGPVTPWKFR